MTAQAGDTFPDVSTEKEAEQKSAMRRLLKARRASIPHSRRLRASRMAAARLMKLRKIRAASKIAVYVGFGSEIGTAPLIAALLARDCKLFAPSVNTRDEMHFLPLHSNCATRRDALGLPRPTGSRHRARVASFDVMIVPLLGFDTSGARLGMGGGYYDRALAAPRIGRKPWLVGYSFAIQRVDAIIVEPFDVRLDAIATEQRIHGFPHLTSVKTDTT